MESREQQLRGARALQEAGDWPGALAGYLRALALDPVDPAALLATALAHAHEGQLGAAEDLLKRCLALRPDHADAAKAYGAVILAQGRHAEAAQALARARALAPRSADVHFDLGGAYMALGRRGPAAASYRKAARLRPGYAHAHNQLGNLARLGNDLQAASRHYERAVRDDPGLAEAWYNLGTTRQLQKRFEKAEAAYRRALELVPANASAANNLGLVLKEQGRVREAIQAFERAVAAKPEHAVARVNLGAVLQHENRLEEAVRVLREAIALTPGDARAHGNLGNALLAMNRPTDALAAYRRALEIDPGFTGNLYNVALAHLVTGDLEHGWEGYDSRLDTEEHRRLYPFTGPRWKVGEPIAGKSLLVYAEQGLGDTLQFIRYVRMLEPLGARVTVQVQQALKPFLAGQLGAAQVVGTRDPVPSYDLLCSLLSLPRHLGTRLESIPSQTAYLAAPAAKAAQWRAVFAHAPGLKVGLAWSGNPKHQFDYNRSMPLALMRGVMEGIPAHFFAIQKEAREADRQTLAETPRLTDLSPNLAGFADTAAIVSALDLVITVDTSVAHLAGALGTRAWVLLSHAPDWRWMLGHTDSPWYPSLRLYRQPALGQWEPVIEEVRSELGRITKSGSTR